MERESDFIGKIGWLFMDSQAQLSKYLPAGRLEMMTAEGATGAGIR